MSHQEQDADPAWSRYEDSVRAFGARVLLALEETQYVTGKHLVDLPADSPARWDRESLAEDVIRQAFALGLLDSFPAVCEVCGAPTRERGNGIPNLCERCDNPNARQLDAFRDVHDASH